MQLRQIISLESPVESVYRFGSKNWIQPTQQKAIVPPEDLAPDKHFFVSYIQNNKHVHDMKPQLKLTLPFL